MKKLIALIVLLALLTLSVQAQQFEFNSDASHLYQQATNAMRLRRLTVARQYFNELIEKFPDDSHAAIARRHLASILRDLHEYDAAIELLEEIIDNDQLADNRRAAQKELIDILYELQRFRRGIDLLEQWRMAQPEDTWLGRELARFYLQSGRKDEAWLLLQTLLERNASSEVFRDMLDIAMRSGEVEQLISMLEDRRNSFKSSDYASFVADCYLALKRPDLAIEAISNAQTLKNDIMLLHRLANLQMQQKMHPQAIETLEMILKIVPDDWDALKKLGRCKFILGDKEEALRVWRRPLEKPFFQRRDFYQNYATVLIEHQLLEEALDAYYEGRQLMGNPIQFSGEIATLLDAMGRREESLEEYLKTFASGQFKPEAFDRLFDGSKEGFELEKRLKELDKGRFNVAIKRALLEYYFRNGRVNDVPAIVKLVVDSNGLIDDHFYERMNQEALLFPDEFDFRLAKAMMTERSTSTLALKLAILLLDMAALDQIRLQSAFEQARKLAETAPVADAQLKADLLARLASFSFLRLHDPDQAIELAQKVLQSNLAQVAAIRVEAGITMALALISLEQFDRASDLLEQVKKQIKLANENVFTMDPVSEGDYYARAMLAKAMVEANSGNYQQALDLLKSILEEYPESEWVNDSLSFALYITRRSIGDLTMLAGSLQSQRLVNSGKYSEGAEILKDIVKGHTATDTPLITEIKADIIAIESRYLSQDKLFKNIEAFATANPDNFKTADLYELKWLALRKNNAPDAEIHSLLLKFIEQFPSDLRSARFRRLLANMAAKGEK